MPKHLHYAIESQDCDGRYSKSYTMTPPASEQDDDKFTDWTLVQFAMALPTSLDHEGTDIKITYRPGWFGFVEPTEEGFRAVEISVCGCDRTESTQRDHSAEAAGY